MGLSQAELKKLQKILRDIHEQDAGLPLEEFDPLTHIYSNGDNCLHVAAWRSNLTSVRLLIKGGVDINSVGENGYSPLDCALTRNDREVVCFLIENGAKCLVNGQAIRVWIPGDDK